MTKLSSELISAAREGRLALFLGAGASRGSQDKDGNLIPDGGELADAIVAKYLLATHRGLNLKEAYDLACSRRSVRELQKFLHDTLIGFQPTDAHKLIPHIPWAGISTTNYDLLVERAYASCGKSAELVVAAHDGAHALDAIPKEKSVYLKLHGTISEYENIDCPLITSTEQIIDHANGRANLFKTFHEWGQNYTTVIVGYGMNDDDMRSLFYRLVKERDGRPRHYIVRPGWDEVWSEYWRDRRFETVDTDMATFITEVEGQFPTGALALAKLAKAARKTSITPLIVHAHVSESDHLVDCLGAVFEHVTGASTADGSAAAFYSGVNQEWYPIEQDLDARRSILNHILRRCVVRPPDLCAQFYLIKGHAGAGKSVLLRRIAWEAALTYERLVLLLRAGQQIDTKALEEIWSLTNKHIYLFIDDAGEHLSEIRHLLDLAGVRGLRITIVGAERVNEWNVVEDEFGFSADGEFNLEYLTRQEIEDLVVLLELHGSLGELAKLTLEERIEAFSERAGRQLLVALHEATRGASFDDILESEYEGISSLEAKVLYLDICALHRFGPPVRAGLVSRVHGISFQEFQKRFFKPLESVVMVTQDKYTGDYAYQARHNYIAETVFYRAAKTPAQKLELMLRIIDKLNTEYSYDELVLYELVRSKNLADLFTDRNMGVAVLEAAERSVGRTARLLHQWALYELRLARERGGLDRTEVILAEALALDPDSMSLRHTLAELALRRSELARSDLEAVALRQQAGAIAKRLAANSTSSHAHHTLSKVALGNLDQALREDGANSSDLTTQAVNQAVQEAEAVIRAGLNRFPNDGYLLEAESQLAAKIKNASRALASLQRAFASNPKSELVANRLALMLQANGELEPARVVLKRALDSNPGSTVLNFRYARLLMDLEPGIDYVQPDLILHYLKRSLQKGAANIDSQFWYGRQLYLSGREKDAKAVFDAITKQKLSSELRNSERAYVLESDGVPKEFYGEVAYLEDLFGFVKQLTPSMTVYFRRIGPLLEKQQIKLGARVKYRLGFNARGPVASDLTII